MGNKTERKVRPPKLFEATLIIPECYNDGQPVPYETMEEIRIEVLTLFGGYTEEQVMGAWIDNEGEVYKEMNMRLTIAVPFGSKIRLKGLALSIGKRLGQKAMYYSYKGEANIIEME